LLRAIPAMSVAPASRRDPALSLYDPLPIALAAVAAGIALDRYFPLPAGLWWSAALAAWLVWLALWKRAGDRAAAVVLLGSLLAAGAAWHHLCWQAFPVEDLGRYAGAEPRPVAIEAVALEAPRRVPPPEHDPLRAIPAGPRSRLELRAVRLRDGAAWQAAAGRIVLLVDGELLGVAAGDRVLVFGHLSAPSAPDNPGEFDFAAFARGQRRLSVLRAEFPDCLAVLEQGAAWDPRYALDRLRVSGDAALWRTLGRERSGLAAALLLGLREELDTERSEDFLVTGTVHVLAISGMHVAILAGSLLALLRLGLVPRRGALLAVAALAVVYTALTDAPPSAVRACVLVLVICLGQWSWRPVSGPNSLAAAGLVVLAINPTSLFQVGAQLSFLCVAALGAIAHRWRTKEEADPLARLLAEARPWPLRFAAAVGHWTWRLTLAGLIVWLFTAPLVMARFHLLSPVAAPLTVLTWIPVSLALLSGFLTLVCGWIAPPLAPVCGWVCDVNLRLLDGSVGGAARVPGSHFWLPGPADWWLAGFYGGALLLWAAPRWRPPLRWIAALLALWVSVGLARPLAARLWPASPEESLDCAVLSVGHGCATVLHLPGGQTLLYDAGSLASPHGATEAVSAYLWSRGLTHVDAIVLSHADVDHYNGVPELLERFSVGVVYVSPMMFDDLTPALEQLQAALAAAGVEVRELSAGQRLRLAGGTAIEVLHPPEFGVIGSDNANSLVLDVRHAGRRLLLTGDLEPPGLQAVLAEAPRDCDVLLAPHHGSRLSDPPGIAQWCTPEHVLISGGHSDDAHEADRAYAARGAEVRHTADGGAVMLTLGREAVVVLQFQDDVP
jgi:competence protein ComEC